MEREYNVVMVRLQHVLDSWRAIRQDTLAAVEEFPEEQFDFRPVPEAQSFREIARHILSAGYSLTGLMLAGELDFGAPTYRERLAQFAVSLPEGGTKSELAAALKTSLDARLAELAGRPPAFFDQMMTRMDGGQVTRLEMLQFIKEHELTHRAQLFVYLRMKGIVPATTRRRMAKAGAK